MINSNESEESLISASEGLNSTSAASLREKRNRDPLRSKARSLLLSMSMLLASCSAIESESSVRNVEDTDNTNPIGETASIEASDFKPTTEYGFNMHLIPVSDSEQSPPQIDIDSFKKGIDLLSEHDQDIVRVNLFEDYVSNPLTHEDSMFFEPNMKLYDEAIEYASSRGIKVVLVTNVPNDFKDLPISEYSEQVRNYYSSIAQRWGGKISDWQIFNEPDVHNFRDYGRIDELNEAYLTELNTHVSSAARIIKASNPDARITVNVSIWPVREPRVKARTFQMFDAIAGSIDYITLDLYPNNFRDIEYLPAFIKEVVDRYKKPIAVGEIGFPTSRGRFSEQEQRDLLIAGIDTLKISPVESVIIYELEDEQFSGSTAESESKFGAGDHIEAISEAQE